MDSAEKEDISERVRKFIGSKIDSVEQLEVLLFVRNNSNRSWTSEEVSKLLRSNAKSVERRLFKLYGHGVLELTEISHQRSYQFAPKDEELEAAILELVEVYSIKRYSIINLIYSGERDRLHMFVEAFQFGKRGQHG